MRIISQPVSAAQLRPVEALQGIRNRVARDSAPETGTPVTDEAMPATAQGGDSVVTATDSVFSPGNTATVGAGVTAQKVFHAVYGGPAETSLPQANRAYDRTDSLRFKDVPFTLKVV